MFGALVVVLAQLAGGTSTRPPDGSELLAFAAASPRPAECVGTPSTRGAERGVWDRARSPRLARYCDALAQGYASLSRSPDKALAAAERAHKALAGRAPAFVLEARALVALGRHRDAWDRFEKAKKLAKRSAEAPGALHDFAIAALKTGRRQEAVAAYRALAPRAGLLGDGLERQRVYVEAAAVVMLEGESGLNEAVGYLTEARRKGSRPGFGDTVLGMLALALDRQGRSEEARGIAAEARGGAALVNRAEAGPRAAMPELPEGEEHAVIAILAERHAPDLARDKWQAFLASPAGKGPWAAHASKRLDALKARRGKGR
jgi:tetratricopeptide (TPR) repeat protein